MIQATHSREASTTAIAVSYVNHMGDDNSVVDAARVSFDKASGDYSPEANSKLIKYLSDHGHLSPFNHCFATFHVKAPIFVARQLQKHEYLPWNEISRRYVTSKPEFYLPEMWRTKAENVKQGSTKEPLVIDGKRHCKTCQKELEFIRKEDEKMKFFCSPYCQGMFYRKETNKGWAAVKVARLKASSQKRGIYFNLSTEDLLSLGRPSHCKYLEVELDYSNTEVKSNSPSINRIDPSKGYVKDNIEIISNKANSMLLDASSDELRTFIRNVGVIHFGQLTKESNSVEGFFEESADLYEKLVEGGLCAEQARLFLPQAQLTEWYWSGSLGAFAKMCNLRLKEDTQYETRLVAEQISEKMKELYPVSWKELVKV